MDRRRMDAEGGRVVHRERRARKLAVVVAVQNLLVVACLIVTLHVYVSWSPDQVSENIHIQFEAISSISGNSVLQFNRPYSMYMMSLADKKNDTIYINCTGPYVLYIDACYKSLNGNESTGILQLKVVGTSTNVSYFELKTSQEVCRGHHSLVYLKAKQKASLHLDAKHEFKIKKVTVGLSYLLGRRCYF